MTPRELLESIIEQAGLLLRELSPEELDDSVPHRLLTKLADMDNDLDGLLKAATDGEL